MAAENTVTIVGNLATDPDLRFTQGGQAVAGLRVAVNRRIRNAQSNQWEDRFDGYFRVNVWRDQGAHVAESLRKGDRVLVTGRLVERSFQDREGQKRYVIEIEADEVCPSLRWHKATLERKPRGTDASVGATPGEAATNGATPEPALASSPF